MQPFFKNEQLQQNLKQKDKELRMQGIAIIIH